EPVAAAPVPEKPKPEPVRSFSSRPSFADVNSGPVLLRSEKRAPEPTPQLSSSLDEIEFIEDEAEEFDSSAEMRQLAHDMGADEDVLMADEPFADITIDPPRSMAAPAAPVVPRATAKAPAVPSGRSDVVELDDV